ncbi:hypothetical protein H257_11678 [Aphanomyces astaci]|uniref:Uncharacterized protein n=1 Tax=Aphanomyces astaci TaxID=112090 RepID=W4G2T0_APHAT|nr:hypothetical protein H257_11678 [Aphanomyces astaci]ETV73551.1 hypothetical protein H257_11678 [Aphanomyces astaci]|eukprot:XP_009836977.1 hypothetical protein H257_11678 [Aphanomyces astaci]
MHVRGLLVLFALVLVTDAYRLRRTADDDECVTECRAFVDNFQEDTCEPFRYRVPRPALYSRCTEAYSAATAAGCSYCSATAAKLAHITDSVFHYCDQWGRGHDRGYEQACKDGYLTSTNHVKRFLKTSQYEPVQDDRVDSRPKDESNNPRRNTDDDDMVESAESIVQRHLNEARREAINDFEHRDRHDYRGL